MEEDIPDDFNGIVAWSKKNFKLLLMGILGLGGTGTGVGFSDTIYNNFVETIAEDVDSLKGYSVHINRLDSIDEILVNNNSYQRGFNNNFVMSGTKIDTVMDGIPMKFDTETGLFWVEWDTYVYQAVPEGHNRWAVYLFQWQLPKGADNHYSLDPRYFELQ